jgi:biotin carboxylase
MKVSEKSILILGAGIMQMPALRIAKEKGWYVTVADGSSEAPGITLADSFLHIDLKAWEEMAAAAAVIKEERGLDGVFTAGTDFSLTVARVAEKIGLPGISVEAAEAASNKALMRRKLTAAGIAVPGFTELSEPKENPAGTLCFPLVVKPVDNMGSRGVCRVDTCLELAAALDEAFTFSRSGKVLIEEYLDGPEFSIDAIVEKGKVTFCGIADRHICFEPRFVEMGHTIPTIFEEEVVEAVKAEFLKAVKVLGIDNGAAKGDVKYSGHRAWIGEIAARLSGGFMSGWTYPLSSGVEVTAAALNIAAGLPADCPPPSREHTCAERCFISIPGVVSRIEGADTVRKQEYIREVFVLVKPGDRVRFPENNVQKCGNVIASAEKRSTAVDAAEKGAGSMFVRLKPWEAATGCFLFGEKEEWIPDAFSLALQENMEALEHMEPFFALKGTAGSTVRRIAALPALPMEDTSEWHGVTLSGAFKRVLDLTGLKTADAPGDGPDECIIGSVFWEAFLRGGIQGAVWLIDTIRGYSEQGTDFLKELERWRNG